jgi:hypothetical protein
MKIIFEADIKCISCNGTGLYSGMGESDEAAIVCNTCKGTGCSHIKQEYEKFEGRKDLKKNIKRVYQSNPGIKIGNGNGYKLEDFGGMSYEAWKAGNKFKIGMEMRKFSCPCWWYQSVNYKLKPNWIECAWGKTFSQCSSFPNKSKCWERWDKEFGVLLNV